MRALLWSVVLLAACDAQAPARPTQTKEQAACGQASDETVRVMRAMAPACEGCHLAGTRAFFASVSAFQNLIVADARLVKPGDPDASELVKLLEGNGTGAFKQMPIGTKTYADLVTAGTVTLSIDEVKAWIRGLASAARDARPDPNAARVTRMRAEHVQRALYQQLGLQYSDFFTNGSNFGIVLASPITDDNYPMQPVDALPKPLSSETADRFMGLGGGSVLIQQRKDLTVSPTFALTLTQVSQRWCRMAYRKPGNVALFPGGTTTATDAANVKATARRWFRHFHGTKPSDAEVDALYDRVWAPLHAGSAANTEAAWVGLCSAFIRHPDWIFY